MLPTDADSPWSIASPPRRRFPLFDSLRAVAALCVLGTHTAFLSGAVFYVRYRALLAHLNVGVTIFFLISGFLLYRPFVAARLEGKRPPGLAGYAIRRILRIFPAYWLALLGLGLFPGLYGVFTRNWWIHFSLLQNYPVYTVTPDCIGQAQGCGIVQTWSLVIEVAFYAILPIYALAMYRLLLGRAREVQLRAEAVALTALSLASLVIQVWSGHTDPRLWWLNNTLLSTFTWFALGMGLAVASVALSGRETTVAATRAVIDHPLACWAGAVAAYVTLCLWLPRTAAVTEMTRPQQLVEHLGFGLVALLLLLPAVFGDGAGGIPRRILGSRSLSWLGRVSYGIFLWHLVVAFELTRRGALSWLPGSLFVDLTVMTLAVTVLPAALSWYLVEQPLLRLVHRSKDATPTGGGVNHLARGADRHRRIQGDCP